MKYFRTNDDLEFVLSDCTNIKFKLHNHVSKYVVGLVLRGTLKIIQKDQTILCSKDDLFLIPVFVPHAIEAIDTETILFSMCVGTHFIKKYKNESPEKVLNQYFDEFVKQEVISRENVDAFQDSMDIILKMDAFEPSHTAISQIGREMRDYPEMNYPLESLAREIYVNKYDLIRKFKNELGLTPHNFLVQNRIRKAQRLLEERKNIADIAVELGFFDQSHLVKEFKSIVGITPSEYMKSLNSMD